MPISTGKSYGKKEHSIYKEMLTSIVFSRLPLFLHLLLCCHFHSVLALDTGEVVALKDMQAEWGAELDWAGSPSCSSWSGITCDAAGNVIEMYAYFVDYPAFFLSHCIHSSQLLSFLYPAIWLEASWVGPSLIRSGTSSPFSHCMCNVSQSFHNFHHHSFLYSPSPSAIWNPISWVEASPIQSGTLSIYKTCMCHWSYHSIFQINHLRVMIPSLTNLILSLLYSNTLSGTIPASIGNLAKLQQLYVSFSFLVFKATISYSSISFSRGFFLHHFLIYQPHAQQFEWQPAEWNYSCFDRKPCQSSRPVCIILFSSYQIFYSHNLHHPSFHC